MKRMVVKPPKTRQDILIGPTKKTKVIIQFQKLPEFVSVGDPIILTSCLKGYGRITDILHDVDEPFSHNCMPTIKNRQGEYKGITRPRSYSHNMHELPGLLESKVESKKEDEPMTKFISAPSTLSDSVEDPSLFFSNSQ
jgi:hypothetical protein